MVFKGYPTSMNIERHYYKTKHLLHVTHFAVPNGYDNTTDSIENAYNALYNPNLCLVVIQDMAIGIFLTMHMAKKIGYIRMIVERNEYKTLNQKTSCIIITIDDKWDTSKWSYDKLSRFHNSIGSYISDSTLDNIKNDESWKLQHIDVAFLEALSFH